LIGIESVGSSSAFNFNGDRASVSISDVASVSNVTRGTDTISIIGARSVFSSSTLGLRASGHLVSTLKSGESWFAKAIRNNSKVHIGYTITVSWASTVSGASQCSASGTSTSRCAFTSSVRITLGICSSARSIGRALSLNGSSSASYSFASIGALISNWTSQRKERKARVHYLAKGESVG